LSETPARGLRGRQGVFPGKKGGKKLCEVGGGDSAF